MMSNVSFVVTSADVVVLDSGSSLQIGQMASRMIKKITSKPVVAVFNSHYHADHWLGNHAFAQAYGEQLPIYALAGAAEQIKGCKGSGWRRLAVVQNVESYAARHRTGGKLGKVGAGFQQALPRTARSQGARLLSVQRQMAIDVVMHQVGHGIKLWRLGNL